MKAIGKKQNLGVGTILSWKNPMGYELVYVLKNRADGSINRYDENFVSNCHPSTIFEVLINGKIEQATDEEMKALEKKSGSS